MPAEPITNLASLTMTGTAGSSDAVTMTTGNGTLYSMSQASVLGLSAGWSTAEFNVFGNANGTEAVLNNGASIVVQTLTDSVSPTTNAPTCSSAGFTGETNNLNLVAGSCCAFGGDVPGIQFTESNVSGATAQACPASATSLVAMQSLPPSIFVRSTGEADIVEQGPNDSLMYRYAWPGTAWSTATIAGNGSIFSAPSIYVRSTGEADVVAEGPNNTLVYYYAFPGGGWSETTIAGAGTTFSAPHIFVRSTGEADVVAEGPNNTLQYYFAFPGTAWNGTQIAGARTTFSSPSVFSSLDGRG